jgi:hypothetical protein
MLEMLLRKKDRYKLRQFINECCKCSCERVNLTLAIVGAQATQWRPDRSMCYNKLIE